MMLSQSQRLSLESAVQQYEANADHALPYLLERGLTEATVRTYRLGYVAEPARGHSEYVGRIAIPYITTGGVVDIRFRSLDASTGGPKYMSMPGSQVRLFGVCALAKADGVIVLTEGEIDCMTMNQSDVGIPAVGIPGANSWKEHWNMLLSDFDHVMVVCDGDSAGKDFGRKVAERLENVTVIHLPDGEDVNSLYVTQGATALKERLGL